MTVLPRAIFRTQLKVYDGAFFAKIAVNNYHFTYFYIILYDFINYLAFLDIKQTLHYKVAKEYIYKYNQRDV